MAKPLTSLLFSSHQVRLSWQSLSSISWFSEEELWSSLGKTFLPSTQYWLSQLNQDWRIHFQEAHSAYMGGTWSWLLIGCSTRLVDCRCVCKSLLSFLRAQWSCGRLTYDMVVGFLQSVPSCKASYHEVREVSLFLPHLWIKSINKASLYSRERDFNSITQWEE